MRTRLSVFLITLSGLVLEVGLTRIYSASIWYHFAFVAISVALLGWGLGGFTVHLLKRVKPLSMNIAAVVTLLYAVAIPACLWLLVRYPFDMDRLPLYFLAPLLPFFLAGMALSIIFDRHRAEAGTLYLYDLVGAALGAVGVTLLLHLFGGEAALLAGAMAPAVAAVLMTVGASRVIQIAAVVTLLLTGTAAFSAVRLGALRVKPGTTKAMRNQMDASPGSRIVQTGWNAYSRIDCVEGLPNSFARLYIDSDAWTGIRGWDGSLDSVRDMAGSYRALPFRLTPHAETMIIGPGGGPDVVAALASGSRKVTAVEMNPLMLKFVRSYGTRAGNLYDRPDVETVLSEGRNFVSRTDRKFDIILLGFVDSWASVASGGLSLSENYLYTTQAFRAYYDHLKDDGMLVIIRWDADIPRLVSNAVALLGAPDASSRVVVLMEKRDAKPDEQPQMIFMLRRRPFTPSEADELVSNWTLAKPVLVPGKVTTSPYTYLLNGSMTPTAWDAQSRTRIGPVFDDSPFYFAIERPWGMATRIARMLFQVLVFPTLCLLALFVAFGKPNGRPIGPYAGSIVYFASLGFGFISVELALLQNLTLLLGHPIFTLSVLLFTLLASGGIGSALSRRFSVASACLVVCVLGAVEAFALPGLVPLLLPLALP